MELKTNYQYTYFIYPFAIKENKYRKYLLKMLKDKKCSLKVFQKEKDLKLYQYFLPETREFLFSSFGYGNTKLKQLKNFSIDTQVALLLKNPCNIFEYELQKDIQGKIEQVNGIFFNIQKIEIICFNTGICFLAMKTNIEDYTEFNNILNFNYKFKDINNTLVELENYDNIRIQTDTFADTKTFQEFIREVTGSDVEREKINIDTEKFLTYSYVCINQDSWNDTKKFEDIKNQFIKFANILPADSSREYDYENMKIFTKWKYAKMALTKLSVVLFSSSADLNNYTVLPEEFENQYFYTYIINLYKKFYLKKLQLQFKNTKKTKKIRNKIMDFTKKIWIQEITEEETGTLLNNNLQNVLELQLLYNQVKNLGEISNAVKINTLETGLIVPKRTIFKKKNKRGQIMKICCGTDIIEINRIRECIDDTKLGESFLQRVYTQNEINYCESKKNQKYQHYAARFAAKEAVFKAISEQLEDKYKISWKNIEIINDENGKPKVNFKDVNIKGIEDIDLSISHCKEYAVANVTLLKSK